MQEVKVAMVARIATVAICIAAAFVIAFAIDWMNVGMRFMVRV